MFIAVCQISMADPKFGSSYQRTDPDPAVHFHNWTGGEMRRIAEFLEIDVAASLWPELIEAASFESMKSNASQLVPSAGDIWQGGGETFLHKGVNGRWRARLSPGAWPRGMV